MAILLRIMCWNVAEGSDDQTQSANALVPVLGKDSVDLRRGIAVDGDRGAHEHVRVMCQQAQLACGSVGGGCAADPRGAVIVARLGRMPGDGHGTPSESDTRQCPRPLRFTSYMARSARWTMSSSSSPSPGCRQAMPIDMVSLKSWPSTK